ncbi:nidogen isoform X2 [Cherax quadricarinatus]|uniref:nidogen isoform X2 n=1 Tax=Cherax quadricarinatus TaxID=27406 RepID=UPI002379C66B|nr:nidogen-like isoform X2 [Cherax quadricarinatus]
MGRLCPLLLSIALLVVVQLLTPSHAILKSYFYRYGEDAGDTRLLAEDDISSPEISLRAPVIFFGQIYQSIFVNSNGFVSFLTEIPNFFNVQFPLEYPIIAPFYSDVDTRQAGTIWYRETSDPGTISRAKFDVQQYFSSAASFEPQGVFIVTWDGVGPYNQRANRVNTYQLIIVTDMLDTYVLLHYADGGIQWLQGDGKNPSIADARGQAGLISGDGRFHILKGSGTDQVRSLDKLSNCDKPGVWMFRVGQLSLEQNVQSPDIGTSESKGLGNEPQSCAVGGSICHSSAVCTDYSPGFCCSCKEEYFGNGINCVVKDEPLRVIGKVIGNINGVELEDSDLHAYVLTAEGRSYTAISRISSQIGYDVQSITSLGSGIAWLFAKPIDISANGFSTTGGVLNRTAEVDFPQTGHHVVIQQHFEGLDVFNNIQVKTQITGSVPTVPLGSKIEMDAFSEEYTRVKPGQQRARSSRVFRLKGQNIDTPFSVETTIDYDECIWKVRGPDEQNTLRLKVAENIFIQYDAPEEIVRYALSAKVAPLEEVDPCVEGRLECGHNSQCVVDGDTFRCVCERGYEEVFDATLNEDICLDMNECDTGRDNCHFDATCVNNAGSFTCTCNPGFTGNGVVCERAASCEGIPCDSNAVCEIRSAAPQCICLPGYTGDGLICTRDYSGVSVIQQRDCVDSDICSEYASCLYDDSVRSFRCVCFQGYTGDGETCNPVTGQESCGTGRNCSPYGVCTRTEDGYRCDCLPGFFGDGYTCEAIDPTVSPLQSLPPYQPQQPDQPHRPQGSHESQEPHQPEQPHQPESPQEPQLPYQNEYAQPECLFDKCWCPGTLTFNRRLNVCEPAREPSVVPEVEERPLPECFLGKCSCPKGYTYDYNHHDCYPSSKPGYDYNTEEGASRDKTGSCNEVNNCHPNAQCIYDSYSQTYSCQCDAGFDGNGFYCNELDVSCDTVDICHIHAQCLFDDYALRHVCVCLDGYQGDGLVCTPQDECSSVMDCDTNAQCLYESKSQRYKCECNDGYEGDGRTCKPLGEASCNIVNNCDANAECIYDTYALAYRCQCRDGFEGDGIFCTPIQIGCNVIYNCGDNAECLYDRSAQGYRCHCREGFQGDGFFCQSSRSCESDPSVCHPQAACLPDRSSPFGFSCRCRAGFTGDGYTCQEAPDHEKNLLLLNQGLSLLRMPVDLRSGGGLPIHVDPFMTAVGADVDCLAGRFYWTDVRSSSIRSSRYDGTERKPIVTGEKTGSPEDVAVDWVSGNVYWTDSVNDVISVAAIKDGKQRVVIKDGLVNPRGIAVHPGLGLLFWSDWNRRGPKIEVSGLDGSNRRILVDQDIKLPNSLVVEYDTGTLCWADAGTHKIECIGIHGSGRRVVMEGALYPFGLTRLGEEFFYTDWNDTKIHTVNRYSGLESPARAPPPGGSGKLYGIVAVPPSCPPVSNVCAVSDGGCPNTHLCLPNGRRGRTCACTDIAAQNEETPCTDYNY